MSLSVEHTVRGKEYIGIDGLLQTKILSLKRKIENDRSIHLSNFKVIFETPQGDLTKPDTEWLWISAWSVQPPKNTLLSGNNIYVSDFGNVIYDAPYEQTESLDTETYNVSTITNATDNDAYSPNRLYRIQSDKRITGMLSFVFDLTCWAVNAYRTIYDSIKSSENKVYLLDTGCVVIINKAGQTIYRYGRSTSTCMANQTDMIVSGQTKVDNLQTEYFLSANGVYLFHHDVSKKRFRTYIVTYNTTQFLTTCSSQSVDFESCKELYMSYCRAFRSTIDVGAWMDPRCGCVMSDETTQMLINQKTAVTESDQMLVQYAPCLISKCSDNVFDEVGTFAWKMKENAKCPTSLKVCQTSVTSINGEIAGANISSCNKDTNTVDCNNDSSCTMGMKCVAAPSGNKFCRPPCSDAAPCADGFSCVNDPSHGKICLPFSSGSTTSPSTSSNPSTTTSSSTSPSSTTSSSTSPSSTTTPSASSASSSSTTMGIILIVAVLLIGIGVTWYRRSRT